MCEARSRLAKPDAIMHPDIQSHIDEYLATDGNTGRMIALLSEGYQGRLHQIDALGHILQKMGVNFMDELESYILRKVVHSFNPGMADSAFELRGAPDWVSGLAGSRFWATIVVELSRRYPTCKFLCHCLNEVCRVNPRFVKFLPPFRIGYESFVHVLRDRCRDAMLCSSPDDKSVIELIQILTTDDRTLAEAAMILDQERDISLIHGIEKFLTDRPEMSRLFRSFLLQKDGVDPEIISFLMSPDVEFESIMDLESLAGHSLYVLDMAVKKMMHIALTETDRRKVADVMQWILDATGCEGDPQILAKAAECWRNHKYFDSADLSIVIYAVKRRFFATAILPALDQMVSSNSYFGLGVSPPSCESIILQEIAYQYEDLVPYVFGIVERALFCEKKLVGGALGFLLEDLYNLGYYLFCLGSSIEFIRLLSKQTPEVQNFQKKAVLIKIMRSVSPPFSRQFLTEMLNCLTTPHVKRLFFPRGQNASGVAYVTGLEVIAKFCGQLNESDDTRTSPSEAHKYEELRNHAREVIYQSKQYKQPSLEAYL